MTEMRVELVLTAVVGLGALSIDMFLPSLPTIAAVFGSRSSIATRQPASSSPCCETSIDRFNT